LALPFIDETVGSDRLDANGSAEAAAAAPAENGERRPVPRPSQPLRTQPGVSDNPTLDWTNDDGNLNEIGAGRVVITSMPAHGDSDRGE
jgi:hypothetical protein